jgi:hypothetical protein
LAALGEARFGRFALLTDILYMKVDLSAGATRSRGTDAIGGALGVSAGFGLEMTIAQVAAAYEIASWTGLTSAASTTALDIYAGGRAWWQRANVDISATSTLNIFDLTFARAGVLTAEKSVSWFDPLVGMRLRHQFAPAWNLVVSGDVGGFDVGSKFTWQVLGALDYEFCPIEKRHLERDDRLQGPLGRLLAGQRAQPLRIRLDDARAPSSALPRASRKKPTRGRASALFFFCDYLL